MMTNEDEAEQRAGQVVAFVQHISQDKQILETLVGLAGERGYEIDFGALQRFLQLSCGMAPDELTDAELEPVAGGLGGRMLFSGRGPTNPAGSYSGVTPPIESNMRRMKHAAKDGQIGSQPTKMRDDD